MLPVFIRDCCLRGSLIPRFQLYVIDDPEDSRQEKEYSCDGEYDLHRYEALIDRIEKHRYACTEEDESQDEEYSLKNLTHKYTRNEKNNKDRSISLQHTYNTSGRDK